MQRKGYLPGAAALLAVLLTACSGGSGTGDAADDSKPGESGAAQSAEPGRYRTLPDPCRTVDQSTLDGMLPGIRELGEEQRAKAYEGSPSATFDTDRRVGCSWKVESADATHHLDVDFERVVSYDSSVSDDARASKVYEHQETAADLPEPSPGGSADEESEEDGSGSPSAETSDAEASDSETSGAEDQGKTPDGAKNPEKPTDKGKNGEESGEPGKSDDESGSGTPAVPEDLLPRVLDGLGDEAFIDDRLSAAASTSPHRTVTVVFRTSNVVVTVQYDEQSARGAELPDSKELQDKARELAGKLAERFAD